MYTKYYGLTKRPFENTPDPGFLFLSKNHREVLASLVYAINESKGFVLVIGDVGTGKTTLIHALIKELDPSFTILNITNLRASFNNILYYLGKKIGITPEEADPLEMVEAIRKKLEIPHRNGSRQVVLIVDEAHLLSEEVLEDIRLISNIENEQRKLIQIVLVGQNELSEKLERDSLKSLKQRVVVARRLFPLTRKETQRYILHRLRVAGRDSRLFKKGALLKIWEKTQGIPRLINQVCDNAMLIGYAMEARLIDKNIIKEVIRDMESIRKAKRRWWTFFPQPLPWIVGALVAALVVMFLGLNHIDVKHFALNNWNFRRNSVTGQKEKMIRQKISVAREKGELSISDPGAAKTGVSSTPVTTRMFSDGTSRLFEDEPAAEVENRFAGEQDSLSFDNGGVESRSNNLSGENQERVEGENFSQMKRHSGNIQVPVETSQTSVKRFSTKENQLSVQEQPVNKNAGEIITNEPIKTIRKKRGAASVSYSPTVEPPAASKAAREKPGDIQIRGNNSNRVRVRANECLLDLAYREYGAGNESIVDLIHMANPDIRDVNRIYPGQEIILPYIEKEDVIVGDENRAYHIYYASFYRRKDAKLCVQELLKEGKEAHLVPASQGKNIVYRVYIGTFNNRDDAKRILYTIHLKYINPLAH